MFLMRIPQPPPAVTAEEVGAALVDRACHGVAARANEAYWTWDELRRHPMPPGVAPERAWAVVSTLRSLAGRELSLRDKDTRPFRVWITDSTWQQVLRIHVADSDPFGVLERVAASHQDAFRVESLMEEAIHSSILEGAATTRRDARRLLEEGRTPGTVGERMIVNNYRTMAMLQELAQQPLSEALLGELQRSLTHGTLEDARDAGRVQAAGDERVRVVDGVGQVLHRPPPAEHLPARLAALCAFANTDGDGLADVVKAIVLHFALAYEHPFVDGNGRTARALFYWYLLRRGHPLVRYLSISRVLVGAREQYGRAFLHVEQTGDLTYFVLHQLRVYDQALRTLREHVDRRRRELIAVELEFARFPELNVRQKAVLRGWLAGEPRAWTARAHANVQGVTHQTAMADLRSLEQRDLAISVQSRHRRSFLPVGDLARRLRDR